MTYEAYKNFLERLQKVKNESELDTLLGQIVPLILKPEKDALGDELKERYMNGKRRISPVLKWNRTDELAIRSITETGVLGRAYKGLSDDLRKKINALILQSFIEKWTLDRLTDEIRYAVKASKVQLQRIARTEEHGVHNTGAEMGYRERAKQLGIPEGEWRYKWRVNHDWRTSPICLEIERKVALEGLGKGVTMDRLKEVICEVSTKHLGTSWECRPWIPHPNCRSVLDRVVE